MGIELVSFRTAHMPEATHVNAALTLPAWSGFSSLLRKRVNGGFSDGQRVLSIVYPGTTISIGWHVTTINNALRGPVSIELRKIDEDVTFVAVNQVTGTVDHLETREISADDLLTGLQRDDGAKVALST